MEVKIGVQHAARELVIEYEGTSDSVQQAVSDALADSEGMLVLDDHRGRRVVVPAQRVAYVEIGEQTGRRVGFANI
ncbi:MAG: DUF3107 domain-containing protein [Streptosporangiales bacterium]